VRLLGADVISHKLDTPELDAVLSACLCMLSVDLLSDIAVRKDVVAEAHAES
jgi:hypothetical protein